MHAAIGRLLAIKPNVLLKYLYNLIDTAKRVKRNAMSYHCKALLMVFLFKNALCFELLIEEVKVLHCEAHNTVP